AATMRRINRDSRTGETDTLTKSEAVEWYETQAYGVTTPPASLVTYEYPNDPATWLRAVRRYGLETANRLFADLES
ncbi:MAG: hypothetical protein ACREQ5_20230, partial [Candidatus Dormibacteria bacterium]